MMAGSDSGYHNWSLAAAQTITETTRVCFRGYNVPPSYITVIYGQVDQNSVWVSIGLLDQSWWMKVGVGQ